MRRLSIKLLIIVMVSIGTASGAAYAGSPRWEGPAVNNPRQGRPQKPYKPATNPRRPETPKPSAPDPAPNPTRPHTEPGEWEFWYNYFSNPVVQYLLGWI